MNVLGKQKKEKQYEHRCQCCLQRFHSTHRYAQRYCADCTHFRNLVHREDAATDSKESKASNEGVHSRARLRVTYDVDEVDHDGYCSDPGEETHTKRQETRVLHVLKQFKSDDFDLTDGRLKKKGHEALRYYELSPALHGNGYCHLQTEYTITDVRLVEADAMQRLQKLFDS